MATVTGDAFDQFEALLLEQVDDAVINLTLPDDDVSWSLFDTFRADRVAGRKTSGPGYQCEWRVRVQRAGLVTGGNWTGNTLTKMGPGSDLIMQQAADATYPDPVQVPQRSHIKIVEVLKRVLGNLTLNDQQIIADDAAEPLEEIATGCIEDVVHIFRKALTGWWWGDGTGALSVVDGTQTIYEAAASVVALTIKTGPPFRFEKGQRYRLATDDGDGTLSSPTGIVRCVSTPEPKDRTVMFQAEPGVGNVTATDELVIIIDGSYDFVNDTPLCTNGWESLIRATGDFPGTSYDVTEYLELKGYVDDHTSSTVPPTPDLIDGIMDDLADLGKSTPPILISPRRIRSYWSQLDQQSRAMVTVPMGAGYSGAGGVNAPNYTHNEKAYNWLASAMCRTESINGIDPSTIRKFMPLGDRIIHWKYASGNVAGANQSVFQVVHDGRVATELAQAPFWGAAEFGCTDPRKNFRIIGVKEKA